MGSLMCVSNKVKEERIDTLTQTYTANQLLLNLLCKIVNNLQSINQFIYKTLLRYYS